MLRWCRLRKNQEIPALSDVPKLSRISARLPILAEPNKQSQRSCRAQVLDRSSAQENARQKKGRSPNSAGPGDSRRYERTQKRWNLKDRCFLTRLGQGYH